MAIFFLQKIICSKIRQYFHQKYCTIFSVVSVTIYIDVIFFENLIMNCIILYATSIILKIKVKVIRLLISSAIGALYAIILYISKMSIYNSLISKTILAVIMLYIAFKPQNIKKLCKEILIFYLTSFVFGGVALYLIYFINPKQISIKNGMFAGENILKIIILGGIVAFIVIKISFKIIKTKMNSKDMFCDIHIQIGDKNIRTKAMLDTGNLVKEPITNTPVIIVESSLLYDILPKEILNNLDNILKGDLTNIPEEIQEQYLPKLRCIPFSSLGKQNGMLLGIRAEKLEVSKDDEVKVTKNIIVGIYEKSLTKRGEYRALIGIELV